METTFPLPELGARGQSGAPQRSKELGRDAFLQLLVAQLSNQDPLNPQDGHEFAAQLAQFSSVEQLGQISQTLSVHSEQLALLAEGMTQAAAQQADMGAVLNERATLSTATALIGKTIEASGNGIAWSGETPAPFAFELAQPASQVTVTIRDQHGTLVRTMQIGHAGTGSQTAAWDGRDDAGVPLPAGAYTFRLEAVDAEGAAVKATPFTRGLVDRVTMEDGRAVLWIGAQAVPLADVRSVVTGEAP